MVESMRETYAVLARRMLLFRGIEPEDVAQFFSRGMSVECQAGDSIFAAGDPGDELFLILSGEVVIFNEHMELAVLGQGDMFGEMALVSQAPRSASARALSRSSLLRMPNDALWNLLPRDVALQVMVNIAVTLSDRLRRSNETVAQLPEHKAALVEQAARLSAMEDQHRRSAAEARRLEEALVEMQDAVFNREQEQATLEERIASLQKAQEEARGLAEQFLKKLQE
jgi:CRP-like cAMP-binding protein